MSIQLRKRNGHLWLSKYYIDEDNCFSDYRDIIVFFLFYAIKIRGPPDFTRYSKRKSGGYLCSEQKNIKNFY